MTPSIPDAAVSYLTAAVIEYEASHIVPDRIGAKGDPAISDRFGDVFVSWYRENPDVTVPLVAQLVLALRARCAEAGVNADITVDAVIANIPLAGMTRPEGKEALEYVRPKALLFVADVDSGRRGHDHWRR